jgi:hypothetical protein
MIRCVRMFVVMAMMLASWATGAWAQAVPIATTTTVTSTSPNPSLRGELVALTATVVANDGGAVPTGTVRFSVPNGFAVDAILNASGRANATAISFLVGANNVTAQYLGTGLHAPSTSIPFVHTMNVRNTTTTVTGTSPNPSVQGQSVALTATVVANVGAEVPTGTVRFSVIGGFAVDAILDGSGRANATATSFLVGANDVTAQYLGTGLHEPSTSIPFVHTMNPNNAATTTTVSSNPNPSMPDQTVTFTVVVSGASGTPTGTVNFNYGTERSATAELSGGVATFTIPSRELPVGANTYVARYLGAAGLTGSTSSPLVHTVNPLATTTVLTSSPNPSAFGQSVTLTATVTNSRSNKDTVEFFDDGVSLGVAPIAAGVATLATTVLNVGANNTTATYTSASVYELASTSAIHVHTVNAPPGTTDFSKRLDDVQEAATGVAATLASDGITDSVAEEIAGALSGQVQVLSASEGKVGLVYAPGIASGTRITPTADLATGENSMAAWRVWTSLRYTGFDSNDLEGDQINALFGASFLLRDGLTAGLVAGYEKQDYEDVLNSTLKGDGFNIGGYAGGTLGNGLRFDAQMHGSFLNYDLASGPVTAETDAKRLIVSGGFAHMMQFGATTFEPTARINGTWEWQDGYTDSAAVVHGSRNFNFGRIAAGAKLAHRFDLGDGASFQPFATGFADYRFSGGDTTNESLMDGLSARVGLGAQLNASNGITANILGELSGLGLDNDVMVKSVKAQVAIPF